MAISSTFERFEGLCRNRQAITDAVHDDVQVHCSPWSTGETFGIDRDDILGHVSAYTAASLTGSLPLWLHHLGWLKAMLAEHGIDDAGIECLVRSMRDAIASITASQEDCHLLDLSLVALPSLPAHVSCSIEAHQPYAQVVQRYLDALLRYDKEAARDVALAETLPLPDLYMHVIGPAQYQLGRLWQAGRITPAQEHFCTAAATDLMAELRQGLPPRRDGRRLVAAAIAGEQHDLGIRMVADLFEYHGWVALFLGSNVPLDGIVSVVTDYDPDLIALSISMTANLTEVRRVTHALRDAGVRAKIIVGGQPLILVPELAPHLGADATAPDAPAAVHAALSLLAA